MLLMNCGALLLLRHRFLSAQSNLYNGSLRCNNNHAKWQNMQDKIILYWKNMQQESEQDNQTNLIAKSCTFSTELDCCTPALETLYQFLACTLNYNGDTQ